MNVVYENGTIIYAGTPVDQTGKVCNGAGAYGIVKKTIQFPNTSAEVLTSGQWNEDISRANGIALTDEAKRSMSGIVFVDSEGKVVRTVSFPDATEDEKIMKTEDGKFVLAEGGGGGGSDIFVVTFGINLGPTHTVTADKTIEELITALASGKVVIGYSMLYGIFTCVSGVFHTTIVAEGELIDIAIESDEEGLWSLTRNYYTLTPAE